MTKLLEQAIAAAAKLPNEEQDAIAAMILEELADDGRWASSFDRSHQQLSKLANEALTEYKTRRTKPLDL